MNNMPRLLDNDTLLNDYIIVVYDGVCGFCNHYVQFILNQNPDPQIRFVSYQSDSAKKILEYCNVPYDLNTIVVVEKGIAYQKSQAFFTIMKYLNSPWSMISYGRYIPKVITDLGYNLIAKHRYRIMGTVEQCQLPSAQQRGLFME